MARRGAKKPGGGSERTVCYKTRGPRARASGGNSHQGAIYEKETTHIISEREREYHPGRLKAFPSNPKRNQPTVTREGSSRHSKAAGS